ncbi:MAG TPA: hypothetical protein PL187_22235, partial [Caldilinea sp.]|nr:hypothetical protein [Caldilinea sp.]
MLRWKNRDYVRLCDLSFAPTNTFNQAITIGTTIAGVGVVFEVNGVRTEVVSAVSSSVYTLNSASPANVVVWYPVAAARDQSPQLSLNSAAAQGMLRGLWVNPIGGLGQVFCAGHEGLIHSVEPKTWPRPDPGNPILPLNGMTTFRINGSPLVTFDRFVATDMPTTLTLLSFTSTTPVPGGIRNAIDAENTARGGTIAVTYGAHYMPASARTLTPEDFGAVGNGSTDDSAAILRALTYAAGRRLVSREGAVYRLLSTVEYTGSGNFSFKGSKFSVGMNDAAFRLSATLPSIKTISADYTVGSTSVSVAALSVAPLVGDVLTIMSKSLDPGNRDRGSEAKQYRVIEQIPIGSGSTTTNVVLASPLRFVEGISPVSTGGDEARIPSYTTAMEAKLLVVSKAETCTADFGEIYYDAGHLADWTAAAIDVRGFIRPKLTAIVSYAYGAGIITAGTYEAEVDMTATNLVDNAPNLQFGYGISDRSTGIRAVVRGGNVRHLYTTNETTIDWTSFSSAAMLGAVRPVGGTVEGHAYGPSAAAWDTHPGAQDVTFIAPKSVGNTANGVSMRGRNNAAIGPSVTGASTAFQVFTEYDSGQPDDDLYVNGNLKSDWTHARISDGSCDVTGYLFEVLSAWCDNSGGDFRTSSRAAITVTGQLYLSGTGRALYTGLSSDTSAAAIFAVDV